MTYHYEVKHSTLQDVIQQWGEPTTRGEAAYKGSGQQEGVEEEDRIDMRDRHEGSIERSRGF